LCDIYYSRGAQGALLVYDVSRRDSFEHVKAWYDRAMQLGGEDLICVLVGNKSDLVADGMTADLLQTDAAVEGNGFFEDEQQLHGTAAKVSSFVTSAEGEELAASLGIQFVSTSALTGSNVEAAFVTMTQGIKRSVDARGLTGIKGGNLMSQGGVVLANGEKKTRGCC
jgi:Ras-related protein Rab-2A